MPPQPPLAGEITFFNNIVVATARVSAPQRPRPAASGETRGEDGPRGGGRPGGGFGGPGGGEDRPAFARMEDGGMRSRSGGARLATGGITRQALVVSFRNAGTEPVEITVAEVKSLMGNFVPVPETFTLAPAQTQELEPMRSSLSNLDELAVSVTLRRGDSRETQVILLRPAP